MVLGIGNVLMGDDGVGPTLIAMLRAHYRLPEEVELVEAGTPGLDLTAVIVGVERLIVADAVRARHPPGTVLLLHRDTLPEPARSGMAPHDPGLLEALLALDFSGGAPKEVSLIGIVPSVVDLCVTLSEPVEKALPHAMNALLAELACLGISAEPLTPALTPDLWWRT